MIRALATVALLAAIAVAAAVASSPPGATARCDDGSYRYSHHRSGTCSYHGGVAVWLGSSSSAAGGASGDASGSCGVERWAVKTLQDRPALLPPATRTIRLPR